MSNLAGKIKGIKYKKSFKENLPLIDFDVNVNEWKPRCCIRYKNINYPVSKWVSPKRTRSYPYARVYDTYNSCGGKTITIIPIVKDEGADGNMDYLQWDTISLMSLLNVYVILAYYSDAEVNKRNKDKCNKITNQKFDDEFIKKKFDEISCYHSSSLHWNIEQLEINNLDFLMDKVIEGYSKISDKTGVKLHKVQNLENFKKKITAGLESFMLMSREKAKKAQNREFLTTQPKEVLSNGEKAKIVIENYLGGNYYFTVDDLIIENNVYKLVESKHSNNSKLPSMDDIKDGLLKMIMYSNICELRTPSQNVEFKPVIRLTSPKISGKFISGEDINSFLNKNSLTKKNIDIIKKLYEEACNNNFELIIESTEEKKHL